MDQKDSIQITQHGPVAVVVFAMASITDAQVIAMASKKIHEFLEGEARPGWIIFDFEGVNFFSSQILGLLLEIRARMQATGGKVLISAVSPSLLRVFKTTNLDRIFKIFPNSRAAMEALDATP
jgi:anti-sigma B factor antagonist